MSVGERHGRWASMRRSGALLCLLVVTMVSKALAQPPDPGSILKPHLVVLATTKDVASGRAEARRAADRLGYALAPETLRKPAAHRIYVGAVITLQQAAENRVLVASYLGDEEDARKAFVEAQAHFPAARMVPVSLPKDANDEWIDMPFYRLGVLVVGSHKAYGEAVRAAKKFAAASGYPYDAQGMIYDKKRGLIIPDDSDDEIWAGEYLPRRYDTCGSAAAKPCVTVERSEGYEGFSPGLYIVVAGILDRSEEREQRLELARKFAPKAYIKQTTLYLGCMH